MARYYPASTGMHKRYAHVEKKEWTLIVSIGNTIPFDLGTCQGSPDVRLELASGEGLLFNG